jgi:hypothetical protein
VTAPRRKPRDASQTHKPAFGGAGLRLCRAEHYRSRMHRTRDGRYLCPNRVRRIAPGARQEISPSGCRTSPASWPPSPMRARRRRAGRGEDGRLHRGQFKALGLQPAGDDGGWTPEVPLWRYQTQPGGTYTLAAGGKAKRCTSRPTCASRPSGRSSGSPSAPPDRLRGLRRHRPGARLERLQGRRPEGARSRWS